MQITLDKLAEKSAKFGLTIRPSKTKIIAIYFPNPVLSIYNEHIEVVASFCYLGSIVNSYYARVIFLPEGWVPGEGGGIPSNGYD